MTTAPPRLRAGELVEVRSPAEVLATLDERGCLEGMPFMPEMLAFCGQRLRVAKVAHKTCDTKCNTGARSIKDCVHLEDSRCDGSCHDGCQAWCNLFWKTAWLRKADGPASERSDERRGVCDEAALLRFTRYETPQGLRYRCQATQILEASRRLRWWDPRQYVRDVLSGNDSVGRVIKILVLSCFDVWRRHGYPRRLSRRAYDTAHRLLMGREPPYPPDDMIYPAKSPSRDIGLKAGERVRIKPHLDIRKTLTHGFRNRGLWFDPEMVGYCGGEFRVGRRVERIIHENSGEMLQMKGSCIMLDGVVCRSEYSNRRLLCPRAIPSFWREIWLERIEQGENGAASGDAAEVSGEKVASISAKR